MPCDRAFMFDWGLVTMTDNTNTDSATETAAADTTQAVEGSPEALGEAGKKALDAEREARKQADKAAKAAAAELKKLQDRLQQFEDRDKSELDKASEAAARAAKERDDAVVALLRYEVAAEKGLTGDAVNLLSGGSREELEARADSILKIIEGAKPKSGPVVREEGKTPDSALDTDSLARGILLGQ